MAGSTLLLEEMTGAQKGAVLCMAVGKEASAMIMKQLSTEEQEAVSRAISKTPAVKSDVVQGLLEEFRTVARAAQSISAGGMDYARDILESALGPPRALEIIERIQEQRVELGLEGLKRAPPDLLMTVLRGEHPQTIALILAHVDVKQASGVIESMDPDLASDVLYRVARMEKVSPDMLKVVEQGLSSKADLSLNEDLTLSGGPVAVANVLNLASGTLEKSLLESIGQRDEELAGSIKKHMFVFEDLKLLETRSMQRVLRDIDSKELALALKGSSETIKDHIIRNMTERAGAALREEIEYMGAVRVKDVEECQGKIIGIVRALEEAGEVMILGRGGDDDIIE